ncbi:MAG: hypothetical protein HY094_04080 [Candidatus Melainabacteria bacterium]|nr:hypothetical protein [Candidatus Melainabacteria bacterium]
MPVGIDPVQRIQVGLSRIRGDSERGVISSKLDVSLDPDEIYFTPYSMNRAYQSKKLW